jgi:hypothetical protein
MTGAPPPGGAFEDLDGHSLEDLVDYLDRGRVPADPSIDDSPSCRIALAGLERLRGVAGTLLDEDAAAAPRTDGWVGAVLSRIALESRPGRRFPIPDLPAGVEGTITEGALRGLVRAVGDAVPGLLTGRVRIEPCADGTRLDLDVEVSVAFGAPIEAAVAELRRRVADLLPRRTPFAVARMDVRVRDVLPGPVDAR